MKHGIMILLENKIFWSLIILLAGAISMITGYPKYFSPQAIISIIPALLVAISPLNNPHLPYRLTILPFVSSIPIAIIFYFWVKPLTNKIPLRSIVLYAAIAILSIPYFNIQLALWC
jgi:hypothetical protein